MSANQSMLSRYGYDLVLALTQVGINEKLKPALDKARAPDRYLCGFRNSTSYPVLSFEELTARTSKINPFAIPDGASSDTDTELGRLVDAGLLFVIHWRIGSYAFPRSEIDIVSCTGHASDVTYNLLHSHFEIGQVLPPAQEGGGSRWQRQTQTRDEPWFFAVKAGLSIDPDPDSASWPPAVLAQYKTYRSCAVFRAAFALAGAAILSYPAIAGLEAGSRLHAALGSVVLPQSARDNMIAGTSVIGYWLRPEPPTFSVVTSIGHIVSPYRQDWNGDFNGPLPSPVESPTTDQANAATLDLLCAVDNHLLPAAQPFRWNWVKARKMQSYHGVIAVNAATFIAFLRQQLDDHAFLACFHPVVRVDRSEILINQGAYPTVRTLTGHDNALLYTFAESDTNEAYGVEVTLSTSYKMEVDFNNFYLYPTPQAVSTIFIRQHSLITVDVTKGQEQISANIVDYELYQEFPLAIDESGQLTLQSPLPPNQTADDSQPLVLVQTDLSLQWLQSGVDFIVSVAKKVATPPPVKPSIISNFFFPFGNAFSFADVSFSEGLDLFGHIEFRAGGAG